MSTTATNTSPLHSFMLENQFSLKDLKIVEDNAAIPALEYSLSSSISSSVSTRRSSTASVTSSHSSGSRRNRVSRRERNATNIAATTCTGRDDIKVSRWESQGQASQRSRCATTTSNSASSSAGSPPRTRSLSPTENPSNATTSSSAPFRRCSTYPPDTTRGAPSTSPPQIPKRRSSLTSPPGDVSYTVNLIDTQDLEVLLLGLSDSEEEKEQN